MDNIDGKNIFDNSSCRREENLIVLLPVPWEVTASYGKGSSFGPEAIRQASHQLDFYHPNWSLGTVIGINSGILQGIYWNPSCSEAFGDHIDLCKLAEESRNSPTASRSKINQACQHMTNWVYDQTYRQLRQKN